MNGSEGYERGRSSLEGLEEAGLGLVLPFPVDAAAEIEIGQRLSVQQLAAVRSLMAVEAQATRHDILITTAFEALAIEPTSEWDLVTFCNRVWPGAGIDAARVNVSMRVAQHAGYVTQVSDGGDAKWMLTATTMREVLTAKDWAKDVFSATAEEVRTKLAEAGRNVSTDEARLWTASLQHGLMAAARGLLAPYEGAVVQRGPFNLVARHYDQQALRRALMESVGSVDDAELLVALAVDAIDPQTLFGNELLTCITIGYLLHAIMGGRDHVADRQVLGALRGDRAILDTPVLLQLLGTPSQADPMKRVISAAIHAGMEVIAPQHYLDELHELIGGIESEAADVTQYRRGRDDVQATMTRSIVGDGAVAVWLNALEQGLYTNWADFKSAAYGLNELLPLLGVAVRTHNNTHRDDVDGFERGLRDEIRRRGSRTRAPSVTRRDAETMAMAHRARERKRHLRAFFPGAWIVTPDSHISPAYKQITGDDMPLTVTPVAWLGIISNCAPPVEAKELARSAAAPLFGEETFLTVAGRFPVKTAIKLAQTLGPGSGGSTLDVRMAQISLDDLLAKNASMEDGANELTSRVVADVMRKRTERLNLGYEEAEARRQAQLERMTTAYRQERERADAAEAERARERERADVAEAVKRQVIEQAAGARSEGGLTNEQMKLLADRRATSYGVLGALLVATAFLALLRAFAAAMLALVSLLVFWKLAQDWVAEPQKRWTRLAPAALIDLVALLFAIFHWPF
jgi:hypothetical protein